MEKITVKYWRENICNSSDLNKLQELVDIFGDERFDFHYAKDRVKQLIEKDYNGFDDCIFLDFINKYIFESNLSLYAMEVDTILYSEINDEIIKYYKEKLYSLNTIASYFQQQYYKLSMEQKMNFEESLDFLQKNDNYSCYIANIFRRKFIKFDEQHIPNYECYLINSKEENIDLTSIIEEKLDLIVVNKNN